jgi:hypothetical protein
MVRAMSKHPLTRAEATAYAETSRHDDVLAFIDALCAETKLAARSSLGPSGEGRDLAALVLSDRRAHTPERARQQGKAVVLIEANIHAGEVEGKEMVLALARDLTIGKHAKLGKKLLSKLAIVIVPDFNPDGNDRISPRNRALDLATLEGQVNPPGGVGTRYTGEGWNLNRDNTKQEAPETRAMARFYQAWWPELFIDCHTTDGSVHAFHLTYDCPRNNDPLFWATRSLNRKMLDRVARTVEARHGFRSTWYGNYVVEDDPTSGWHTYPALPRFGSHHRGLLGRLDVLLETYSYLSFEERCRTIYAWLFELVRWAGRHQEELVEVCADEELRIVARGEAIDPRYEVGIRYGVARRAADGALVFDYPAHALDGEVVELVAYDRASIRARRYPGDRVERYEAPHYRSFVPEVSVKLPAAYIVPPELAPRLDGHGIRYEALDADAELDVESYRILAREETFSPDVAAAVPPPGEAELPLSAKPPPVRFETVLTVRGERRRITAKKGELVVPTAQRAGVLAVHLLEPESEDGFARWQFLDAQLQVGGYFPIHRVRTHAQPPRKAE